jgi:membrane protease YdiL (CAAX protease family)
MPEPERLSTHSDARGAWLFFALACGITWTLAAPLAAAWWQRAEPAPWALGLAALSAFGPTLAAVLVAAPRRELREVFGRWRAAPVWVLAALLTPLALHLPATALEVALGGQPAQWVYLPSRPEHVAALVMFSLGEEPGWRGFAHPRLEQRYGPVAGALIVGLAWSVWHAVMLVSPVDGSLDLVRGATMLIELPLYSILFAWFFRRTRGSLLVAMALHAGGHLDRVYDTPPEELRIRALRILVLAIAAAAAARALRGEAKRT